MDDEEEGEGKGEGEGEEVYPYGEYEGGRDENLDRHGWGSALLPNGDIYEGEYRHGKRMGKGLYCFRNGARYNGEWRKGLKHGQGEFIYPDGARYIGHWRKDFKHGQGSYYYPNGDTYEGAWFRGFRHGLGTYTYKKINITHFGMWNNGRMEGSGIINYPRYRFHGIFDKNLPIGPGCFTFENKYMQHGFYINVRDPAFDYIGAEELVLSEERRQTEGLDEEEDRSTPKGIVPIWRARCVTTFQPELLPPEPQPWLYKDSEDSLLDIIEYLQQQYEIGGYGEEEEGKLPKMLEGGDEKKDASPEIPNV
ncbi:radial spoke head 1 homolog [Agrilus planipennis]|uniref:Radial spoke head 1 homolog n=1 Tax=Agrilus planipennis TaxID=224129 RepID=A0A1W4XUR1_AGRPL|nr:radial spoke head 1 homolog [Agrilus planipennis]